MDYQQFLQHTCRLDMKQDIVNALTPPGYMYAFRVSLRRWTMSSDTDQRSKMFLKSNYSVRLDRKKHYNLYFWSIHPLSDAMSVFERVYIVMFILSIFFYPFTIDFDNKAIIYLNFVLDLLFMSAIGVRFYVGYIDETRKELILDRREIMKRYLYTFFIVDLVTSFPMNFIVYLFRVEENVTPILRAFRLARAYTVIHLLKIQQLRHGYSEIFNKIAMIALVYILGIWCSASLVVVRNFFRTRIYDDQEINHLFLKALHKVTMILMLASIDNDHDVEMDFTVGWMIFFLSLGYIMNLLLYTNFLMIVSRAKGTEFRFKTLKEELSDYCDANDLPPKMQERLETYYSFRYQQHFYNDADIDYVLTDHLKQEIQVCSIRRLVEAVDIFAQLPVGVLIELTLAFQKEYFLRNDIVIERGQTCEGLYIIVAGTVAIYDSTNKEICHLEDGCYVAELSLLFNVERNLPTTVAISSCEIVLLKKKSFDIIMKNHKEELNKMYSMSQDKLQKTMYVMQLQGYDFIPPHIVVTECLPTYTR